MPNFATTIDDMAKQNAISLWNSGFFYVKICYPNVYPVILNAEEMDMKGIIAAPGMALAAPYMVKEPVIVVETRVITDVSAELERFRHAVAYSHRALERLMSDMSGSVGSEEIEIFDFQLLMLEDTDFIGKMEEIVFERHVNCESAVK